MKKSFTAKQKLWKVMKICAVQVMLLIVLSSMAIAHDNYGQVLERKIVVTVNEVTLKEALRIVSAAAGVRLSYRDDQYSFELNQIVSLETGDKTLGETLDLLLKPYNIHYKVNDEKQVIILEKREPRKEEAFNNLKEDFIRTAVSGRVTDAATGQGLAGVSIIIRGTSTGTTTDADGRYSIDVNENDILVFSFIGYRTFELPVDSKTVADVSLTEDANKLEEVMVNAGYWQVDNREQTGNISRVSSKDIAAQPVLNPLQSIQGRVPGVQITQLTGVPGDGLVIQIRGLNSMRGGNSNDPLYIIDGVPFSSTSIFTNGSGVLRSSTPLNFINPADIESIDILKDADATAIYGSRGANGVVLITTKKGKSGKTKADINFYTGVGTMSRQLDMLNTQQYVQMRKEAFRNDGVTPTLANAPDLLLWDTTRYTDWKKELLGGTARMNNLQANISGGNASTQFLFGMGYMKQSTVFPGDFNYQKGSSHFNINHNAVNSKLSMNLSGNFVFDANYLPSQDFTIPVFFLPPNTPAVYTETGSLNWENGTWTNPYADLKKNYRTASKNIVTNVQLSYELLPGLSLKANGGYNFLISEERNTIPVASLNPATNPTGQTISSKGTIGTWIFEPQIGYKKTLGSGILTTLAGMTFQQTLREKQGYLATGYINDSQLENLGAAGSITLFNGENLEYRYNAVFGRVNYNWKEKLIVNGTFRRDGSSRFGPDNRFANFGAIGAAWIFSQENFIKSSLPFLTFGKIRSSFGVTGSDQIGDYQYLDTYSFTANNYQGAKGLIPNRLLNPDFGWEENKKIEGGIELGFFQDKLFFSASYYHNRSSNQLVGYALPSITGFTSIQNNLPAVIQNTGLEIVLSNVNLNTRTLKWTSSLNTTVPTNRLVSYPNIESSSYANTYQVGRSLFVQKRYKSLGVDPQTGLYIFEDVDNNGVLNSVDTQFIKERVIDYFGGLQNTIRYKQFELDFLFRFVKQTGSNYMVGLGNAPGIRANQPTYVLSRWQKPGDITDVQRFTQAGAAVTAYSNAANTGDAVIKDASFIRLQSVSLSWTMPSAMSGKVSAETIRIYAQGQNLFVLTDFQGADPETQNGRTLSPLRIITVGAQLTF